ncbi:hypothetical protein SteCoe_6012 [Stentor coeruleus]|uniref:LisH domain-containing protein n=1 Tax=Stentor coeruleus TaxID=5963 RepID=A0A1R2CR02_9CILI|nr:hypothetical protein SteCoe_6012 [Stentor coeruleus]
MEFKDIITSNLENSGFLDRIRAELRGEIFESVKRDGYSLEERKELIEKDIPIAQLLKDFLEKSSAEHTLKTFTGETTVALDKIPIEDTLKKLEIKQESSSPAIYELIRKFNEKFKNPN